MKNSTTSIDEKNRLAQQQIDRTTFKSHRKFGIIKEVHPELYQIKVLLDEGGLALNGRFLPVTNPWQQLVHDFGTLRNGMLVEITFVGDQESIVEARIVGLEGEQIGKLQEKPEVNLSLYEIFSPGA